MSTISNSEKNAPSNPTAIAPPQEQRLRSPGYEADGDFEFIEEQWQECLLNLADICMTFERMVKERSRADQEYVRAKLGFSRATVSKMIAYAKDPIWELGFNMHNCSSLRSEILYKHQIIPNPAGDTQK